MSYQLDSLIAAIEATTGKPAKKSGQGVRLVCPAHGGKNHNLYVADGDERLIVYCHSNSCDPKDVAESSGLTLGDLFYKKLTWQETHQFNIERDKREIIKSSETELLILLYDMSEVYSLMFPIPESIEGSPNDKKRVALAWERIRTAADYFLNDYEKTDEKTE